MSISSPVPQKYPSLTSTSGIHKARGYVIQQWSPAGILLVAALECGERKSGEPERLR